MIVYLVMGFALLVYFENNVVTMSMAIAANVLATLSLGIAVAHYEDICSSERHIVDSFASLGRIKSIIYLVGTCINLRSGFRFF